MSSGQREKHPGVGYLRDFHAPPPPPPSIPILSPASPRVNVNTKSITKHKHESLFTAYQSPKFFPEIPLTTIHFEP